MKLGFRLFIVLQNSIHSEIKIAKSLNIFKEKVKF